MMERYRDNSKETQRTRNVSTVIAHLASQHQEPEEIRVESLGERPEIPVIERTEIAQLGGRWTDMGTY